MKKAIIFLTLFSLSTSVRAQKITFDILLDVINNNIKVDSLEKNFVKFDFVSKDTVFCDEQSVIFINKFEQSERIYISNSSVLYEIPGHEKGLEYWIKNNSKISGLKEFDSFRQKGSSDFNKDIFIYEKKFNASPFSIKTGMFFNLSNGILEKVFCIYIFKVNECNTQMFFKNKLPRSKM